MRRILLVMSVAALMVAMIVATAMPAFAVKGGIPVSDEGKGKAEAPGQVKKLSPLPDAVFIDCFIDGVPVSCSEAIDGWPENGATFVCTNDFGIVVECPPLQ